MENREYLNNLFDIYGELLTDIERETFLNYYVEDLSLSEIAINRNISKSSVSKTLSSAEAKLKEYESSLKKFELKKELNSILAEDNIEILKERLTKIIEN
ncbi:MAG: hypothetical protein NC483_00145 [Ruminococcus sp.]|nr:hypothetical protein [Ruminococcus sp.]